MADVPEQTGEGTLYDPDDYELASVAYRFGSISRPDADENQWGGAIVFSDSSMLVQPGLYVLALADGTQVDVDVARAGAANGDANALGFTGVGTFGRRIF